MADVIDHSDNVGGATINNCWFAGQIITENTNDTDVTIGGVVGRNNGHSVTISNCLFTGSISCGTKARTANLYLGGIMGRSQSGSTSISNVLSVGTINSNGGKAMGLVIAGTLSTDNFVNAYAKEGICTGYSTNGLVKPDFVMERSVEQLAGENAKLEGNVNGLWADNNTSWIIGENYPVLSALSK